MNLELVEAAGLKFHIRPNSSDRVVFEDNILRHSYEKHGVVIEKGQAWMDIGGYIGTFSCNLIMQGAKVVIFEPDPDNAELIRANLTLNDMEVTLVQKAVVNENVGPLPLYKNTYKNNMAANTLYPHWKRERPSVIVECLEFNKAFRDTLIVLEAEELNVKFDCEGAEIDILENLDSSLPIKQMTMEYHFSVEPNCARYWHIANHIMDCGFSLKSSSKVPAEGEWPNPRQQTIQVFCVRS